MADKAPPKLARKCYSVDSDENDDDSQGSLEIMSPQKVPSPKSLASSQSSDAEMEARNRTSTHAAYSRLMKDLSSDDSSDDDDDLLKRSKPTFATSRPVASTLMAMDISQRLASRKRSHSTVKVSSSRASSFTLEETKEESRERREQERAHKKRETDRRKQLEKLAREQRKEREKVERTRQKEIEKQIKLRERDENQQASGKFSSNEILLLVDPSLHRNNEFGIVAALEEDFTIKEFPGPLTNTKTIQWVRKEYLEGGAEDAWKCLAEGKKDQFEHLSYLLVIMNYADYIPLIERSVRDLDDDYPNLGSWLNSLKSRWKSAWSTTKAPRVILMLDKVAEELDREWMNRQRKKGNSGPSLPSDYELQDSLQWLLVQFQVDCIKCTSNEEIQANVHKLTRGLAEAPYTNHATELECVRKIKPAVGLGDDPFSKAQDTWLRQLQMVPKISEQRARNLVQHYPTLQSLWQAYQEGDESTNPSLLSSCFGTQSSQSLLSASVHKVLTCDDPKEMI